MIPANTRGLIQLVGGRIVRVPPDMAPSQRGPGLVATDQPVVVRAGRPPVGMPSDAKDGSRE